MKAAGSKSSGRSTPAKAADGSLDIDRTFAFRMIRLVNLLGKRYQIAYEEKYDLTLAEWRILSAIAAQPGALPQEQAFDEQGRELTPAASRRFDRFASELEWYAEALKNQRLAKGTPY